MLYSNRKSILNAVFIFFFLIFIMATTNLSFVVNVDLSHADISAIYHKLPEDSTLHANANIELEGKNNLHYLERVFWFKADSLDIKNTDKDVSGSGTTTDQKDFLVAVNTSAFAAALRSCIETSDAGSEKKLSELRVKKGPDVQPHNVIETTKYENGDPYQEGHAQDGIPNTWTEGTMPQIKGIVPGYDLGQGTDTLAHDLVRYIAYQLTGGYYNSDIFANEQELFNEITNKLDDVQSGPIPNLVKQLADGGCHGGFFDPSHNNRVGPGLEGDLGEGPDLSGNYLSIHREIKLTDFAPRRRPDLSAKGLLNTSSSGTYEDDVYKYDVIVGDYLKVASAPGIGGGVQFDSDKKNLVGLVMNDLMYEHDLNDIGEFLLTGDYRQEFPDASGGEKWRFIRSNPGVGNSHLYSRCWKFKSLSAAQEGEYDDNGTAHQPLETADVSGDHYYDSSGEIHHAAPAAGGTGRRIGKFQNGHSFVIKVIFRRIAEMRHSGNRNPVQNRPTQENQPPLDPNDDLNNGVAGGLNKVGDRSYVLKFTFKNNVIQ